MLVSGSVIIELCFKSYFHFTCDLHQMQQKIGHLYDDLFCIFIDLGFFGSLRYQPMSSKRVLALNYVPVV